MRIGCLIAFSVSSLTAVSYADTVYTFSVGPGTNLNATQSWYAEVLPGNPPPQIAPPNYGLVSISADFEAGAGTTPCNPIDSSMPAVCQGAINDIVQLEGVDGTSGGAVVQFDVDFKNCAGCDNFAGYFTACTTAVAGSSPSPYVQCYLPPGIYQVSLSIFENWEPITNAFTPSPFTSTLTASIGGVIPAPEPSTLLPCFVLTLLMIGVIQPRMWKHK